MSRFLDILCVPTEEILISGGDSRIAVDKNSGLNSFSCSPLPRPNTHSFGSSTASSISFEAYRHLEYLQRKLRTSAYALDSLDTAFEILRQELLEVLGIGKSGNEVVFSPSGTDSTLQSLYIIKGIAGNRPLDCILLAADETGSGVPNALLGRHFSKVTSRGMDVQKGAPIGGLSEGVSVLPIAVRGRNGYPKSADELDQEVCDLVSRSVKSGHEVLLQAMDSSKTGLRSPSHECLQVVKSRFCDEVHVVVDACQMRLSRARLKWHLDQEHIVLISGSKYFTGPPFSGALLVPKSLSNRIAACNHTPVRLTDYTTRGDWPIAWTNIRTQFDPGDNLGQYFRWSAALHEMRSYFEVPLEFRVQALSQFESMVSNQICESFPNIQPMPGQDANSADSIDEEMVYKTIFPILLRHVNQLLSAADSVDIYKSLNQNMVHSLPAFISGAEKAVAAQLYHLGQPVAISSGEYDSTGALRICASARTVSTIWKRSNRSKSVNIEPEAEEIRALLDKIELLIRHLPREYEKAA